jgi:hypothetical protein
VAVKLTCTLLPLAILHELIRTKVTLVVVAFPPLNPDCRQPDAWSTRAPLAGTLPNGADGVTVMEPPLAKAAVAVKLTA